MFLIFDTETTGFPKKDLKDPENPHIIQLAWGLYTKERKCFKKYCQLIKPEGWEMPSVELFMRQGKTRAEAEKRAKFWIDKGFNHETSLKQGVPIAVAVKHFVDALDDTLYLIAHNMDFDLAMMAIEMIRLGVEGRNKPTKFCTLQTSRKYIKIPKHNLTDLHIHLLGKPFDGAHSADADVLACWNCFEEMEKRKIITIPN